MLRSDWFIFFQNADDAVGGVGDQEVADAVMAYRVKQNDHAR